MKKNNSFICLCGHIKEKHSNYYALSMCEACINMVPWQPDWRHEFKMDNLRYLEEVSKNG
jgi:hypothetical protein